ncbi:MAG: hypothetical protein IH991_20280 [Planctomycetes bacterium]|nr:hypothetical protein [Planctomycetota bacterium]
MKLLSTRTRRNFLGSLVLVLVASATVRSGAADLGSAPQKLPLLHIKDFQFAGAFRLPSDKYGASDLNYSQGPIAFNPDRKSLFIVGHSHQQAIAEFKIPKLVSSKVLSELNMASDPIQSFARVLHRASGGNPDNNNRIGGMLYIPGRERPQLLVNTYEYYDAPGDSTTSTLVLRDANDLAKCDVNGYFKVQGGPGHTAGWLSPIPTPWQSALGGGFLMGNSSGIPIISRASVGPTAFVFNPSDIVGDRLPAKPVSTIRLLDFSLGNRLHDDLYNKLLKNKLWNHLSQAVFGVIVPGTRTYATFGSSGGNETGIGYKIVQDNGALSGGYSSRAVKDNYHYYWLWDVNDLTRVRAGKMKAHEVRPYEYGILHTPFASLSQSLGGGTFDPNTGRIYLTAQGADREQGKYANPPVVMAYKVVLP